MMITLHFRSLTLNHQRLTLTLILTLRLHLVSMAITMSGVSDTSRVGCILTLNILGMQVQVRVRCKEEYARIHVQYISSLTETLTPSLSLTSKLHYNYD